MNDVIGSSSKIILYYSLTANYLEERFGDEKSMGSGIHPMSHISTGEYSLTKTYNMTHDGKMF